MPHSLDAKESILGANNANNSFDSSNVVANADGSIIERLEHVQTTLAGMEPVTFEKSESPSVDEDGGRFAVSISIVDMNSGPIASGSIDITGITYSLEKSTAGGAYATGGITQPSGATKANGIVRLEFDIDAAEWAIGDRYRLEIGGVTATVGSTTYYSGTKVWSGTILEDLDVKTSVDDINTDLGEPNDAAVDPDGGTGTLHAKVGGVGVRLGDNTEASTDPSAATGTLFSKLRGAGDNLDTIIADTDELQTDWADGGRLDLILDARASQSSVDAIDGFHDVPSADATADAQIRDVVGRKTDTAQTSVGTVHSLMRYVKGLMLLVGQVTGPTAIDITTTNDTVTENTIVEVTSITKLTHVIIDIDLSAAAQSKTLRFYTKPNGTDYQIMDPPTSWTTADADGVHYDVWVQDDFKLTTQNVGAGEAVQIDGQHVRVTFG